MRTKISVNFTFLSSKKHNPSNACVEEKEKWRKRKKKRQQWLVELGQHVCQERWKERVYSLHALWAPYLPCQIILNVDVSIIDSLIHWNTRWYEQMAGIVNPAYSPVTTLLIEAMISFKIVSVRRWEKICRKTKKKRQQWIIELGQHVCQERWRERVYSLRGLWSLRLLCEIILNVDTSIIDSLIHWNARWYEQTGSIINHGYNPMTTLLIEAMISFKIVSVRRWEKICRKRKKKKASVMNRVRSTCLSRTLERESLFSPWTMIITSSLWDNLERRCIDYRQSDTLEYEMIWTDGRNSKSWIQSNDYLVDRSNDIL